MVENASGPAARNLPAERTSISSRSADYAWGLLMVAVTVAAYVPAIRAGYIWDDDKYLTENPLMKGAGGLWRIWTEPRASSQYYPLVFTSFWIEHKLWGLRPLGFHLVNVLFHAANAILVWRVLRRLAVPGALPAGMIFALHPVHVESVAWVTERKNVLSGLFYLAAISVYLKFCLPAEDEPNRSERSRRRYFCALALFVCALLSKSVTASMPAAALLIVWWKRGRLTRRDATPLIPFFVIGVAAALHTAWLEKHHVGAEQVQWGLSALDRFLVGGRVVWFYCYKLLWPAELIFFYPRWTIDAGQWWQYVFPLAALAVIGLLWKLRVRFGRGPLTAVLYFVGTLFPVLGFVKVYPMVFSWAADHFQYLASIAMIALFTAVGRAPLASVQGGWPNAMRFAAAGMVLTILFTLTWRRCRAYQDEETLWRDTVARNPGAWAAYNNWGALMVDKGEMHKAEELYREAVRVRPDFQVALDNLGTLLVQKHRDDEAFGYFKRAVEADPYYPPAQRNYGRMLCGRGNFDEGIRRLMAAVEMAPDAYESHEDLGDALFRLRRIEEAITEYRSVLQLKPGYALGHSNLGVALATAGQNAEALSQLRRAVELDPKLAVAHYTLGSILAGQASEEAAVAHFKKALECQPVYPMAHNNLATVLAAQGHMTEAIEHFQRAVRQDPANADARFNLARALETQGRWEEAIKEYGELLGINPDDEEAQKALAAALGRAASSQKSP